MSEHCTVHDSDKFGDGTCWRYATDVDMPLTPLCDFGPSPVKDRDVLLSIVKKLLREPYVVNREVMPYAHSQRLTAEQAEVLRRLTGEDS